MITTLIAEDEPLARRKLRGLIGEVPDLTCVGEAADGAAAVRAIDELTPDLVFLDIKMPELSGLEVLERVQHRPRVVFTTAYDTFAVTAFELGALDYLLKPFGKERLLAAVERARAALAASEEAGGTEALDRARAMLGGAHVERLFVRERGRIVPVALKDVRWIEARGDYVALHLPGWRPLVRVPISNLEARLDPARFVRIHRSSIANLDHVAALVDHDASRLRVELTDGTQLLASRTRSRELRSLAV
jgi:two-component system LytT family response regulator